MFAQVTEHSRHQNTGVSAHAPQCCRSEVSLLGQAHEVQAGHLAGHTVVLQHTPTLLCDREACQEIKVWLETRRKDQRIDLSGASVWPDNTVWQSLLKHAPALESAGV